MGTVTMHSASKKQENSEAKQESTGATGYVYTEKSPLLLETNQDIEINDVECQAPFSSAVFNLSTTMVGAIIMALPATLKVLGLPLGLVAILLCALLTNTSLYFFIRCCDPSESRSYGSLMAKVFGKAGRVLTQMCIIIGNGGALIVYMIIIDKPMTAFGDVLSGTTPGAGQYHAGVLVEWGGGPLWWNGRVIVMLATTIFVIAPLVSFKRVDSLKHSSALSVGLAVVFVVIMAAVFMFRLLQGKIEYLRLLPDFWDQQSFWRLFTAVPVLIGAFICHHSLHPIANEMKGSWEDDMPKVCRASLLLCCTIYITTALFGYLVFGENTATDLLSNFDSDLDIPYSAFVRNVVRVSYAIHLMLVYPMVNFTLRLNVDSLLFQRAPPLAQDNRRFTLLTAAILGMIFFGSTMVPNIWVAIEFIGATSTVLLGFIFPGAIVLRDSSSISTRKDKLIAVVMVVLAISSSVFSITTNLLNTFSSALP